MDDRRLKQVKQRLEAQARRGELILVTGAGFSLGASDRHGRGLPSSAELREELWRISHPSKALDGYASLGDVFRIAQKASGNRTRELLRERLQIDASCLPDWYRAWASFPWVAHYTFNLDDWDQAVGQAFELPRQFRSMTLSQDFHVAHGREIPSVHLNGRFQDYPNVTFSPFDYGKSLATGSIGYQQLVGDLMDHGAVFVGTVLEEPNLWRSVELRRLHGPTKPEVRPGSYLVSRSLDHARRELLSDLQIDFIEMTAEDFALDVLGGMLPAAAQGVQRLKSRASASEGTQPDILLSVEELRSRKVTEKRRFLLGRQPDWEDLVSGYAVIRDFEALLADQIVDQRAELVTLTGTSGSGKSTTLMRLALALHAAGKTVRWMNTLSGDSLARISSIVADSNTEVLCIDDADRFGQATGSLLVDLASGSNPPIVLAALRSTRYVKYDLESEIANASIDHMGIRVPHLEDSDIDALIRVMTEAKVLGALQGKSVAQQHRAFAQKAGRQLLVAMIEVTSGVKFTEKVASECDDLDPASRAMYAVVCLASSQRLSLRRSEVMLAAHEIGKDAPAALARLIQQHLIVETGGMLSARHAVIAKKAVEHFRLNRQVGPAIGALLWGIASSIGPAEPKNSRPMRLLRTLMSHDTLIEMSDHADMPRDVYGRIESLLDHNHHFWLQRGRFELEAGDLEQANLCLESAKSLGWDDPIVRTTWANKELRVASLSAGDPDSLPRGMEAINVLRDIINERGDRDTYAYHILGAQGMHFGRRMPQPLEWKKRFFGDLDCYVEEGVRKHPKAEDLRQLSDDVKREYLSLVVDEQ